MPPHKFHISFLLMAVTKKRAIILDVSEEHTDSIFRVQDKSKQITTDKEEEY
jgi:hypothetical protein